MLEWVFRRCDDAVDARRHADRPAFPTEDGLDTDGLEIAADDLAALLASTPAEWLAEIEPIREFYATFGDRLPGELRAQLDALEQRLRDAA